MSYSNYKKSVAYLESLAVANPKLVNTPQHIEWRMRRMKLLMRSLGNPQRGFKIIHITGTAGKGTVATMLHSILVAGGKNAGLYTSPHVTTAIERTKVGDKYIAPEEFVRLVNKIKSAVQKVAASGKLGKVTFREAQLAVAFLYFKKMRCEWVVLEVGAGGTSDPTNFIKNTKIAVITNIGISHTKLLGNNLKAIAVDKAGVIKKGSIFWTSEKRPELLKLFHKQCLAAGAKFNKVSLNKKDDYMAANLKLAAAVGRDLRISEKDINTGLANFKIPGRFEIMPCLKAGGQNSPTVVLDGAHNELKMKSVLFNLKKLKYRKLHLIIPVPFIQSLKKTLQLIIPKADKIYFTSEYEVPEYGNFKVYKPKQALALAFKIAGRKDLILATGSFQLVGQLRRNWYAEKYILKKRQSF